MTWVFTSPYFAISISFDDRTQLTITKIFILDQQAEGIGQDQTARSVPYAAPPQFWPLTLTGLNLVLPFATTDSFCGEGRARSDCTYVESDLALHSPLLRHQLPTIKPHPVPFI